MALGNSREQGAGSTLQILCGNLVRRQCRLPNGEEESKNNLPTHSCDAPRGIAVHSKRGFVFVACSDHVIVLDTAQDGRVAGSIPTGAGVDNIDYACAGTARKES